ncbi:MAG: TolC family protein [Paludibacter sp.]
MRKYKSITFLIFLSVFNLYAQNQTSIITLSSFEETWNYALKNNPDQKSYLLNIEKAKADKITSQSFLWPSINGSFSGQYNIELPTTPIPGEIIGKPGTTIYAQFGQKFNYSTGIMVNKEILNWQNYMQLKLAQNNILTTQLQADAYKQSLKQQVALFYFTTAIAQEALETNRRNLAHADSIVILTNQKQQQGLINSISANQALISRNNIRQQIASSEMLVDQCKISLKILCGLKVNTDLQLNVLELKSQQIVSPNQNLNPDKNLAVVETQVKGLKYKVDIQKGAYLPKLNTNWYMGEQQYRKDFGLSFDSKDWYVSKYLGISLQIPIFNGFSTSSRVKSSKIEYQKAQNDWEESKRKAALNDDLLIKNFTQSSLIAQTNQENYRLYTENEQLANQQFRAGIISLDDYLKISEDYLKAENNYLNSLSTLYNYYSTIISRQ